VKGGVLGLEHARTLRQLAGDRTDADYDSSATFTADDAAADLARATSFVAAVEGLLPRSPS
jgi:hypothetical protein